MGTTSKLEAALREVAQRLEDGRAADALRFADRARRLAPNNATLLLLQANIQIRLGFAAEAAKLLTDRNEPALRVARAEALCILGLTEDAAELCPSFLRTRAVDAFTNLRSLAQCLVRDAARPLAGWIGIDTRMRLVGEVRADAALRIELLGEPLQPTFDFGQSDGLVSFSSDIPSLAAGKIVACAGHIPLIGSGLAWPPEFGFRGWVAARDGALIGEVGMDWAPSLPLPVRIARAKDGIALAELTPEIHAGHQSSWTFSVVIPALYAVPDLIEVSARLPDESFAALTGTPLDIHAVRLSSAGVAAPKARPAAACPTPRAAAGKVDVVIPVYGAAAETLQNVTSVIATVDRGMTEIIVVDDASPDIGLRRALLDWANQGAITLVTNPVNLGFPGAANRGMRMHPERDVVLLNSDSEPFTDWLHRLRRAAYSAPDIGTVTPFGESASIATYAAPVSAAAGTPADIDRLAARVNLGQTYDLPVGVGFCLYIKRACLDEAGLFDELTFGRGYGEENDFCLRASHLGWRHVLAADVFVGHPGGRSFGRTREVLMARHRHVLHARYPYYESAVEAFQRADPLLPARRALDVARLKKSCRRPVLLVTQSLPGGVQRHVNQRRELLEAKGHAVLELRPAGFANSTGKVQLQVPAAGLKDLIYELPLEFDSLRSLLSELSLVGAEIHHFLGLGAGVLELVAGMGIPYQVFIHDYAWICPRVNLLGGEDQYCGEPAVEDCDTCVRRNGSAFDSDMSVAQLRSRSSDILARAARIVAPTRDTWTRIARYFPELPVEVSPWEADPTQVRSPGTPSGRRVRVAVIGAIGVHKGYRVLHQCAIDAAARGLGLDFVVIGYTPDDETLMAAGNVFVTGPYEEPEVQTLFDRESCDLAWFPSVTPETWCYALTHSLALGCPIVAFGLGAIGERLGSIPRATLLPLGSSAAEINDALQRCVPASERREGGAAARQRPEDVLF